MPSKYPRKRNNFYRRIRETKKGGHSDGKNTTRKMLLNLTEIINTTMEKTENNKFYMLHLACLLYMTKDLGEGI
jgi:hypothetical protein